MLKEFSIKYSNDVKNRWFSDDELDLIVWTGRDEDISGFQLCYDKRGPNAR